MHIRMEPRLYALTELQLAIMDVLWTRGEATVKEIHDELRTERDTRESTVASLLGRLEERGVLSHRKRGRQNVYSPTIERTEIRQDVLEEFSDRVSPLFAGDVAGLVNALLDVEAVGADDLRRIRELIRRREQALAEDVSDAG